MHISTISGAPASPLGLAAHPDQDPGCIRRAVEAGINFFYFYSAGQKLFVDGLEPFVRATRSDILLASGSGSRTSGGLRAARRKSYPQ
jgi:hypothetical protein